ncbi:mannose-6-phosphate receptor binding protein 1 isoform X2 [Scleropages formosus]|uniref:mannose-6-phosphate receptor binding protein 1 isoform X2 n=1 Tax=Scleropages formosus TaxID=113540 RepID=UPI00087869A3|nr:perilipin-3-like isoform X2 [Scleropages formosus]
MADSKRTSDVGAAAVPPDAEEQQSVVSRVGNLPFVSSACGVVSSAYSTTKDSMPLLRGVMDAAESGVRTLGAAASTGSKPLLDMLEPQIAVVNEYAMKGLDKMEQNFPILQQPADKLVSDTVGVVCQTVSGAKDVMKGAVIGGVELTRAAVSGGLNTVLGTRVGQMVSSGMDMALRRSEDWVDHNLPLSERELAELAEPLPEEEAVAMESSSPNYFVRLGKLSAKVRERALEQSLGRARHARDATHAALSQIANTLDLLESARAALASASQQLGGAPEQLLQRWTEWQSGQSKSKEGQEEADAGKAKEEQLEWRTLSMVRSLSEQLRSACLGVVSSAQGLPAAVQDQLGSARRAAEELHSSLSSSSTLSPSLLEQSRQHLAQVRQSMDGVMEYLLHNTPLNWLVGPFAPQITEKGEGVQQESHGSPPSQGH